MGTRCCYIYVQVFIQTHEASKHAGALIAMGELREHAKVYARFNGNFVDPHDTRARASRII